MSLRTPSTDRGAQSFWWAVVFAVYLLLGGLVVGLSGSEAILLSLVSGFFIFLFVRTRGVDDTTPIGS